MPYMICWTNGQDDTGYETPGAALAALEVEYEDAYAIHEVGQIEASTTDEHIEGGSDYRVLVWATEEESVDDPGTRCIASIRGDK